MSSKSDHNVLETPQVTLEKGNVRRQAAEARYLSLFDNASDGIFLFDDRKIIFRANPKILQMLGYRFEDIKGRKIPDLIHPNDLEKVLSQLHRLLAGEAVSIERRRQCQDGRYISLEQSVKRISENVIMSLYRDITARKKADLDTKEALQNAEDSEAQHRGCDQPDPFHGHGCRGGVSGRIRPVTRTDHEKRGHGPL